MILNSPTISGSLTVTGNIISSGSITLSGSVASASYALSASNAATASSADNFLTRGTLTAQTLVVQTITSSVDFVTGSTRFGSLLANTHTFTGSMNLTGSLTVTTTGTELQVNATGVKFGNVSTDTHTVTGSMYVTGAFYVATGSVGIGTVSPSQLLEVVGGEIKAGRVDSSNEGGQVSFGRSTDNATAWYIDAYGNTASPQLRFVNVTNAVVAMTITGSNVGIGVNNPNSILQVGSAQSLAIIRSTTTTNYAELQIENTTNYLQIGVEGATGNRMGGTIAYNSYLGSYANYGMTFHTNNLNRMTITSGGQVLINTASSLYPNVKLAVKQTLGERTMDIWSNWSGDQGTTALSIIKFDNVSTTSQVFQRFVIDNGNVASGQINANGASSAAFGSWSDIRLKENIVDLPSQLSNILSLRPIEFDYKNGSGHQIGFIAQEMQEVYPDVIGEDSEGYLTVTGWSKTEARLVKAIQELKTQNDDLQSQINELKAQ
jgi:hypothetical protein